MPQTSASHYINTPSALLHPFSLPTPGTPRRPRPTQPSQPPPGLGIKQALDPPQPAHHILVLLPPTSSFHSSSHRPRPGPRPLPPHRRHRALTPPMPDRRPPPSPHPSSGPHPHPHQTLIPQHLHQHLPARRLLFGSGTRVPLRGAILPRTKEPMLPQRIEMVHRRRDQDLVRVRVDLAALEHPQPEAAQARVAGRRVGDLAEAGVGEALPAEEGEGEGGAVWGFCCGGGWRVGEEGGGQVGEDGVEVEGGREAEVEVVGEEGGAGDQVVVALAEGGEGEAGVGEGEAEEGVCGDALAGWWGDGGWGTYHRTPFSSTNNPAHARRQSAQHTYSPPPPPPRTQSTPKSPCRPPPCGSPPPPAPARTARTARAPCPGTSTRAWPTPPRSRAPAWASSPSAPGTSPAAGAAGRGRRGST